MDKPVTEYYKNKEYIIPNSRQNTTILNRLEQDIALVQTDIKIIKDDLRFIKEYINIKKVRENARWF